MGRVDSLPGGFGRVYAIRLEFFDPALFPAEAELSLKDLVAVFRGSFIAKLKAEIEKEARRKAGSAIGKVGVRQRGVSGFRFGLGVGAFSLLCPGARHIWRRGAKPVRLSARYGATDGMAGCGGARVYFAIALSGLLTGENPGGWCRER